MGCNEFVVAALHSLQRDAQICNHSAQTVTKLPSEGMAPGAYGQTSASLGGSFSHNAPISVCSLATVTVQFVRANISSGHSGFLYESRATQKGSVRAESADASCKTIIKKTEKGK